MAVFKPVQADTPESNVTMRRCFRLIPIVALAGTLSGCDPSGRQDDQDIELIRRQVEAIIQYERQRCEFWQAATYATSVGAVILLVLGVAIGSRSRKHAGNKS
jgi:hypothetical protein